MKKLMINEQDARFMREAIAMAAKGIDNGEGGPFGCVIVDNSGEIIGRGNNKVTSTNDPTAHAEIVAIREACQNIKNFQLENCIIYTSCEPCPMCLGAIYWARPTRIVYACTREDAAKINFDDDFLYKELVLPIKKRKILTQQILQTEALEVFKKWQLKQDKIAY